MIFTLFVQIAIATTHSILLEAGNRLTIGTWTESVALSWGGVYGTLLGLSFAIASNKDWPHKHLRKFGWTTHTSSPSEWFSAFHNDDRYIVLHLKDGRRLFGWPWEWPDQPDLGHFIISDPRWLLDDGNMTILDEVEKILISAYSVEMVEFVYYREEQKNTDTKPENHSAT